MTHIDSSVDAVVLVRAADAEVIGSSVNGSAAG